MKRIIIIGGTSLIAEHCARLWTKKPTELVLVGRNLNKLNRIAQDLKVRSPDSIISSVICNFSDPISIQMTVNELSTSKLDIVLIAHGCLARNELLSNDISLCNEMLYINGISACIFSEAFANQMELNDAGKLIVISSVAGERGRKSNYVYGAAKSMLTIFTEGLQHRLGKTNVKVFIVKPGPTETPMTAHLMKKNISLASPEHVAKQIVAGVNKGVHTIYSPSKWRLIMFIVRQIPNALFKHLDL